MRRNEIKSSTRSIIQLRREEARSAKIARSLNFEKPRSLSTIGFNNRRIKIGLGMIRSPFCHKIGMYGGTPAEVTKAGLRRRPVSAPRNRRENSFTRSNVYTQSTRSFPNNQRPQSAMPALGRPFGMPSASSQLGNSSMLGQETLCQISSLGMTERRKIISGRRDGNTEKERPQSAIPRRVLGTTVKVLNRNKIQRGKQRPQSAHAGRITSQQTLRHNFSDGQRHKLPFKK